MMIKYTCRAISTQHTQWNKLQYEGYYTIKGIIQQIF
jgi:hypothetical protein